ncbi:sensor histidine kinase [Gaoshiqia sp. Z1-71]|uniref:sensor histidine kinase n=1 Tax=Gaoshiqia hydrogeniformans TaxID=3290090 RepID=UPI003BF8599E
MEESYQCLITELNKVKERNAFNTCIISMLTHEFVSSVTNIRIAADIVEAYFENLTMAEIKKKMYQIQHNVDFLKKILEKAVEVIRLEGSEMNFYPAETEVNEFIAAVIEDMKSRQEIRNGIVFQQTDFPVLIDADRQMMKIVLINLLSNAIKYTPDQSEVAIQLAVLKNNLLIHVTDQGIGIPDEDADHVFDPFYRGANVGNIPGTGVGLCLTRKLVHFHGGLISFRPGVNNGTTFTVTLPGIKRLNRAQRQKPMTYERT